MIGGVVASPRCYKSAAKIARELGAPLLWNTDNIDYSKKYVIWGCKRDDLFIPFNERLNFIGGYHQDKLSQLETLRNFDIRVPRTFRGRIPKGEWAVIRPLIHQGGDGFTIAKGPFKMGYGVYGVRLIRAKAEYRVFVGIDEDHVETLVFKRVPFGRHNNPLCKSQWGYADPEDQEVAAEMSNMASAATGVLGYKISAVDIVVSGVSGRAFVVDVNSAPSLDNPSAFRFVIKQIKRMFGIGIGPVAQRPEQGPHKATAVGSNPTRSTNSENGGDV